MIDYINKNIKGQVHARKWQRTSTTLKTTLKTDWHMQQSCKLNFIHILNIHFVL